MTERYLIDYDNPDAGIGHSMGFINRAIKIALRNQLSFAYSESQLVKSSDNSWKWQAKQFFRALRGSKRYETHNIGNDLNQMLDLQSILPNRESLENRIRRGEVRVIDLPKFEIEIPSNENDDDVMYQSVDQFIKSHPGPNIAFRIRNNGSGDYEYSTTRDWFNDAYKKARNEFPIPLSYDSKKLNIALHIRRGDLLPGRQFADLSPRMLPDGWYIEILNSILSSTQRPIAIHIFSEGKDGKYHSEKGVPFSWRGHFKDAPYEIQEHIDSEFLSTFHHLVHADILIGSKSGMSHLAGMLSKHIKLMPKMWHSYRGADHILELPDSLSDSIPSTIETFIKQSQA